MKKFIISIQLLLFITQAKAQIDLDEVLHSRINSTERLQRKEIKPILPSYPFLRVIHFSKIKSIEYTIDGGEANVLTDKVVFLPVEYVVNYYSNKNCSDNRRGWTQNLVLKVVQGHVIRITNSVKSSRKVSFSLGFKIPIPYVGDITGSTSSDATFETSNSQEVQRTITTEETVSKTINFEVDPKKELFVKFQTIKYILRVPFEAQLLVNGYVVVQNISLFEAPTKIQEVVTEENIPISSLLSSKQRTFTVSGFLENSKAGKEEVEYAEVSLSVQSCESLSERSPLVTIQEKLATNKALTKDEIDYITNLSSSEIIIDLGEGKLEDKKVIENKQLTFRKSQL